MPDDIATEQIPDVGSEQVSDDSAEQQNAVADTGVEPVADDGGAVAGSEVQFDLSTDEGILAAAEANPTLKGLLERFKRDGENTGRQRTEAELRRKAASDEQIMRWQQDILRDKGVEISADEARQLLPWMDAHWDQARLNHAQGIVGVARQFFGVGDDPALEAALAGYGDDPEQWDAVAGRMMATVAEKASKDAIAKHRQELLALSPADLRKDPDMVTLLSRWQEAEDKAEERAARTRANRVESSGITSSGTAPGGTERYLSMSPAEAARLPDEEYRLWQEARSVAA